MFVFLTGTSPIDHWFSTLTKHVNHRGAFKNTNVPSGLLANCLKTGRWEMEGGVGENP